VGGGVIADGKLLSGADNAAAELGHMKVDFSGDAAPCGCGKFGCVEAYGGIAGIQRIAHRRVTEVPGSTQLNIEELTTKKITEAAHAGDAVARGTLYEVGIYLGRGIANMIETFNPEKVVLSGGASAATDFLVPGIKMSLNRYCAFHVTRDRTIIERSSIADAVGFLGPAAVFLAARGQAA
jgi:glucokinase